MNVLLNLAVGAHDFVVSLVVAVVYIAFVATPAEDVLRMVHLAHNLDRITNDSIVTVRTSTFPSPKQRISRQQAPKTIK